MFDFKELEAFVWVVRLGSFRKGATKLYLTQPSISDRITRLEDSVGESLLDRSARPVQPTLRGREFFTYAERLLAHPAVAEWIEQGIAEPWVDEPHEIDCIRDRRVLADRRQPA